MPFIEIKTNINLTDNNIEKLKEAFEDRIKLLNKTKNWLMLNFVDNQTMYFNGNDEPCMIVEVKLYGDVDPDCANKFTSVMSEIISLITSIEQERIYFNYFCTNDWGYCGYNF